MIRLRSFAEFRSPVRSFARERSGVSAVEFAIILPLMVTIYLGSVELVDGMAIQFKATEAARGITDLASRYTSIDATTMSSILNASSIILAPYSTSNVSVVISEITTNPQAQGTIAWSCSLNGTPHPVGQSIALPSGMQKPNFSLLWGEVTYPYQPQMGYVLTGTITIYQTAYFVPRESSSVTGPPSC